MIFGTKIGLYHEHRAHREPNPLVFSVEEKALQIVFTAVRHERKREEDMLGQGGPRREQEWNVSPSNITIVLSN